MKNASELWNLRTFTLFQLRNESEGNSGAGCNSMIMLFTDGGTDHAQDVFDHYNQKENMVKSS